MKRLTQHIISLLRLYDKVELPGVGVYTVSYVPARLDREKALIFPPHLGVEFEMWNDTDEENLRSRQSFAVKGSLLDSYIRKEKCTNEEASLMMENDLEEFRNYLAFGGNPLACGISELNPALAPLMIPSTHTSAVADKVNLESHNETLQTDDSLTPKVHYRNPDYYYIPIHKKIAKIAACFLLVVIVGIAAMLPLGPSVNTPSTASILPISVKEESLKEKLKSEGHSVVEDTVSHDKEMKAEVVEAFSDSAVEKTDTMKQASFYAIVAAFKTENEAHKFIDSNKGDKSRFDIIKNRKYYLISASSSTDREELEVNMPLIRAHFPDAWIFALK